MAYSPLSNMIIINKNIPAEIMNNKMSLFSLIRHELQHYNQNMQIFRHEELGEKAITLCTDKYADNLYKSLEQLITQNTPQEVISSGILATPQDQLLYMNGYNLYKRGDMRSFGEMIRSSALQYRTALEDFRGKAIDILGPIKKDSTLTPKIQQYLDDFLNIGYYNQDGKIDYSKYFSTFVEQEAMLAQGQAEFEFSGEGCFIKMAKKQALEIINNTESRKFLDSIK